MNTSVNTLLRKKMIELRKSLSKEQRKEYSHRICEAIIALGDFQHAHSVMVYYPYNNEVDIKEAIQWAWSNKKQVAFPKITGPGEMQFYKVEHEHQLKPGNFGIMEPVENCPLFIPTSGTMMIVPGTAFSITAKGIARMGYGGGYYDHYLQLYKAHLTSYAVGFDFQLQEEHSMIIQNHDQYVDHLITPSIHI